MVSVWDPGGEQSIAEPGSALGIRSYASIFTCLLENLYVCEVSERCQGVAARVLGWKGQSVERC